MRPIWIILAIAISITTSASAQGVDQNTRQQIEQLVTTYRENWNNHNAAGIAGLYTKDGVLVSQAPKVVKTGTQEIAQQYETIFKTMSHNDAATAEVSPLGTDSVFSVGKYHLRRTGAKRPRQGRRALDCGICARGGYLENPTPHRGPGSPAGTGTACEVVRQGPSQSRIPRALSIFCCSLAESSR
jgi:uncharacterized protein (TIGR02246 family)